MTNPPANFQPLYNPLPDDVFAMPPSVETIVNKLHQSLQAIRFHAGVKSQQEKRIQEAFVLLVEPQGRVETKTQERRECYREFLRNLQQAAGLQAVVLCAVAVGQSAVANMKERLKIELVAAVKVQKEALSCPILQKLVDKYSAKVTLPQNAQQSGLEQQLQYIKGPFTKRIVDQSLSERVGLEPPERQPTHPSNALSQGLTLEMQDVQQVPFLPDQSVINLNLKDLFEFLLQQSGSEPKIRMICSWNGIPLPSIDIRPGASSGFTGRIELSIEKACALIQHVNRFDGNTQPKSG